MKNYIDPHLHFDAMSWEDLELMAICGVHTVISHTYYPHLVSSITSQMIFDLWDRLLTQEMWRADQILLNLRIAIGVNMMSVPSDFKKILTKLPEYFEKGKVVAVGEVGIDPRSSTCSVGQQEEILFREFELAKEYRIPIVIHTPPETKAELGSGFASATTYSTIDIVNRIIDISETVSLPLENLVIDHLGGNKLVIERVLKAGAWAGITVQPWRKVTDLDAAKFVNEFGPERILIDTDSGGWLPSDPLGVPKTAYAMRKVGLSDETIRMVLFDNPVKVFNLKF
jgi:predicted metal-dependent TIM-barrel fold hydrolase